MHEYTMQNEYTNVIKTTLTCYMRDSHINIFKHISIYFIHFIQTQNHAIVCNVYVYFYIILTITKLIAYNDEEILNKD